MQKKLKKIELNEEFIAMCRGEEQNLWNVISPFYHFPLGNTYERVQFSEVAGLQPATLLKTNSFLHMKQRFQRCIHKNLPHSLNLFDKCRQLFIFNNRIAQLIGMDKWIVYLTLCIMCNM